MEDEVFGSLQGGCGTIPGRLRDDPGTIQSLSWPPKVYPGQIWHVSAFQAAFSQSVRFFVASRDAPESILSLRDDPRTVAGRSRTIPGRDGCGTIPGRLRDDPGTIPGRLRGLRLERDVQVRTTKWMLWASFGFPP